MGTNINIVPYHNIWIEVNFNVELTKSKSNDGREYFKRIKKSKLIQKLLKVLYTYSIDFDVVYHFDVVDNMIKRINYQ